MAEKIKICVDTGGTFTDFVFFRRDKITNLKIPSTPHDPSVAIYEGVNSAGTPDEIESVTHGSTVATNALLEKKGGRIAFITTKGFEDILFIARQTRKELFTLTGEVKERLLERSDCYGIAERTGTAEKIKIIPDENQVAGIYDILKNSDVESLAICLINSYADSGNEEILHNALSSLGLPISLSSKILPEYREYERASTTAINAYLVPTVRQYLENLGSKLPGVDLRIMQSNSGYISPAQAAAEPVRMALSGPAGGVVGASEIARVTGHEKIITFDMGGTSTDVSLVDGKINMTNETEIAGMPLRVPMIDIYTVGAGGGSIAFKDSGGALKVGPESAGANPGPACYGNGMSPAVTDANLVLGRIWSEYFLGGNMDLYPERSREAVNNVADELGKPLLETAEGIIRIADANMEKAIRVISVERGINPAEYFLFAFGGAGGLHAASLAEKLNMRGVIVPKNAGVLSAFGMLMTDSVKDYSRAYLNTISRADTGEIHNIYNELISASLEDMKKEGFAEERIKFIKQADLRYEGQSYEIMMPFDGLHEGWKTDFAERFHAEHEKVYSYRHQLSAVEIVTLRLRAIGLAEKIEIPSYEKSEKNIENALMAKRQIVFNSSEIECAFYNRAALAPGHEAAGPAVIVDYESTIFVPPGYRFRIDRWLNVIMTGVEDE